MHPETNSPELGESESRGALYVYMHIRRLDRICWRVYQKIESRFTCITSILYFFPLKTKIFSRQISFFVCFFTRRGCHVSRRVSSNTACARSRKLCKYRLHQPIL